LIVNSIEIRSPSFVTAGTERVSEPYSVRHGRIFRRDGAQAGRFLQEFKNLLENPATLLIG
jgi:pyruvate/2-oxoglutarate dehydrogenase complex dihydrolipoamide acyltransferase (E2) component